MEYELYKIAVADALDTCEYSENQNHILDRRLCRLKVSMKLKDLDNGLPSRYSIKIIDELRSLLQSIFWYDELILQNLGGFDILQEIHTVESTDCYQYRMKLRQHIECIFYKLFQENTPVNMQLGLPGSYMVLPSQNDVDSCVDMFVAEALVKLHCFIDPYPDKDKPVKFDGKQKNKLAFKNFICKFMLIIGNNRTKNVFKLLYLRYYLSDDALELIRPLAINNNNYVIALNMLKEKYLDNSYVMSNILKRISKMPSPPESENIEIRIFIHKVFGFFSELQKYDPYILNPASPDIIKASQIVLGKLPSHFKTTLVNKVSCNTPTLIHIFQHCESIAPH